MEENIIEKKFKVDFIVIGAPRSATTWLYYCLQSHPGICMSSSKETGFFTRRNYRKGEEFYADHFKHCKPGQIKGDNSPPYFFQDYVIGRIKKHNKDVKLIATLRNPIDRMYSSYLFHKSQGGRANIFSFEEAINEMRYYYVKPSMYYQQIRKYLNEFPKENMLIMIYEDMKKDPKKFIKEVYEFLGVDSSFVPEIVEKRINIVPADLIKNEKIIKIAWKIDSFFRKRKDSAFLGSIYNFIRYRCYKIWGFVKGFFMRKPKKVSQQKRLKMNPKTRERLRKIFKDDIEKMEKLLGRNLSFWKK